MAAPAKSKWANQAQVNAILRYAPQRQALAELTREAKEQYGSSVEGAESTGRLTTAAIDQAQPQQTAIYDRAQQATSGTQAQLASALAGLGSSADPFRAAAATEAAGGADKLARERAQTEGNLVSQRTAAAEAPQFAQTLAQQQLAKSLSKIFASQQSIAGQEGEATASEAQRIEKEARDNALTERGQDITARSDTEGHALTAAGQAQSAQQHSEDLQYKREHPSGGSSGAGYVNGVKQLTTDQQNAGASEFARARQLAHAALGEGHDPNAVAEQLAQGVPSFKTKKGNKTAAVAPVKSGVLLQAAVEAARVGSISRARAVELHKHGYALSALGVPVAKQPSSPGDVGRQLHRALGF